MADDEFTDALERCELPNESFHHRDHLRLAWIYLRRYARAGAGARISESIRRYAAHHGQAGRYHETMTQAWLLLMAEAVSQLAADADFESVLTSFPGLLDKNALRKYYSDALLQSDAARNTFVDPDLARLEVGLLPTAGGIARPPA